ncbi:MAG: hypothetical protein LBM03_01220 [Erysipelotrichaceae bacterium]|jgi:hypothetical protein|nr:hypothetical protein [Erysipelotrichaceae bacterium]
MKEKTFKWCIAKTFEPLVKIISKTWYVKLQYQFITHKKLNLKDPETYTEKLQFLRLYTYPKNELVTKCAGRVGVREYLKDNGLENLLIPIYGVFDRFEDIDFDKLPSQFVMKCTHASGLNYICLDKNKLDFKNLKKTFKKWLKTNYGKKTVEMHYAKIKPQIIIEKYLGNAPIEYKIHVFNGTAKYMYVVTGRGSDIRYNNYYIDWKPFNEAQFNHWKTSTNKIDIPTNWNEMVKIAEKLAATFPFVRVDLYNINGKIYFSELTFTPAKGTLIFDGKNADEEIGKWLKISISK